VARRVNAVVKKGKSKANANTIPNSRRIKKTEKERNMIKLTKRCCASSKVHKKKTEKKFKEK